MAKIIAVIGATGKQGGSVVSILRDNPDYHVRAITRNPSSLRAKDLEATGVEVVQADLDDTRSLVKAFEGASYIFAVTDFWEPYKKSGPLFAMGSEFTHGQNAAIAAAQTPTLEHFIWSTLPDVLTLSEGRFHIPHFQAKSQVNNLVRGNPHLWAKTTLLLVGFYADNFEYPTFAVNKIVRITSMSFYCLPSLPSLHSETRAYLSYVRRNRLENTSNFSLSVLTLKWLSPAMWARTRASSPDLYSSSRASRCPRLSSK
jgi:hypothetical protein